MVAQSEAADAGEVRAEPGIRTDALAEVLPRQSSATLPLHS
jgi:hypothetical protein